MVFRSSNHQKKKCAPFLKTKLEEKVNDSDCDWPNQEKVWIEQRNWVFATNSDFLITISLEPNVVDLRYFETMKSVKSNNLI